MDGNVSLRRTAKQWAEALLASSVAQRLGRHRRRKQRLILAYHNVIRGGQPPGERSLHLDFDDFRRQLDACVARARVLPVHEVLARAVNGPAIAITFDDAYEGALICALPEIAARGLTATVFVSPGLLGQGTPWWDQVAAKEGTLPEQQRQQWLEEFAGDHARILAAVAGSRSAEGSTCIARLEQLREAARLPGVTLGAHTLRHPNLCRVDDARLDQEIRGSVGWLGREFPSISRAWLAYPYGRFDQRVQTAARRAGCEAAFAIAGGWFGRSYSVLGIPRLNVPAGMSYRGFLARLNGLIEI